MKALKIVGAVVAVVAIVASAGALAFPAAAAVGSAAATAGGVAGISAATLGAIAGAASIASGVIGIGTALFAPKPGFNNQGNALDFQTNPQSGLPYAIGRTRMSGLRIHADTYDGFKLQSKDDILAFAVMLSAAGPVEEIEQFTADKEVVSFDPSTGNGSGSWTDWMAQKVSLGAAGASALALSFGGAGFPGWTSAHKLTGIAHALWDLRYDSKGEKYGAGVPEPAWIGKWVKVYDPRLDSTYPGGSGSHRALDEATYEWSRNPYLHALTWALGRWQNGKKVLGIGAPVANIRLADFVEGANVAEANDWYCGGVEWSTDSKWSILKRMLQAGGGEPTMAGAMIGCRVNTPRVPIATVGADHLLDSLSISTTRSRRDRFNTVIPRFRSEDHDWEVISGSPVTVPTYVDEDGGQRTKEIDFPLVQHELGQGFDGNTQAGQLAAYEIVNSREGGPVRFTVGPQFIGVKTGDVVTLDVPDEGLDAQPVLIRSRSIDPATLKITFEAETETTAKHDFALGKTTIPPPTYSPTPPDLTPPVPDASLWSLIPSATADGTPALIIEGVCEFPGADTVLIQYRRTAETDWSAQGKFEASAPVRHIIAPVDGETQYTAQIAYRSDDRLGGWLTLTAVTTPPMMIGDLTLDELADLLIDFNDENDGNAAIPPAVTGVTLTGQNFSDSSGETIVSWDYDVSTDPGDPTNIDGFVVGIMMRANPAGYSYNPGDDDVIYWQTVQADRLAERFSGTPVDQYITAVVIPFRNVRRSVEADGIIKGPAAQSSATTPFHQADAPDFRGTLNGAVVTDVVDGSNRARIALTPGGNVGNGKVLTGSIAANAINNADWVAQGGLIVFATDDISGSLLITLSVSGSHLTVQFILDHQIRIMDPATGDEPAFTVVLIAENQGTGITYSSGIFTISDIWNTTGAAGLRLFPRDSVGLEWVFEGLPVGVYRIGYVIETDALCGLWADSHRYLRAEDNRAKA